MSTSYSRILSIIVLFVIIAYGMFRTWVLRVYAQFLEHLADLFNYSDNLLFTFIKDQAQKELEREQTLGWLLYYPSYFLLHIAFIWLLFNKSKKSRKYLIISFTTLIGVLVILWVLFLILDMPNVSWVFRYHFKKLFGLPFILLIIEGGRILYQDFKRLMSNH